MLPHVLVDCPQHVLHADDAGQLNGDYLGVSLMILQLER